jgi:hypothetical protein
VNSQKEIFNTKMGLYKKDPREYPNWERFNPQIGYGQMGRFRTDTLTCLNESCPRYKGEISEKEAFYLFATQGIIKRLKPVFLQSRLKSLYICPFCGHADSLHPANNDISTT